MKDGKLWVVDGVLFMCTYVVTYVFLMCVEVCVTNL